MNWFQIIITILAFFALNILNSQDYNPNQIIVKYKSPPKNNSISLNYNSRSINSEYRVKNLYDKSTNLYVIEGNNVYERLNDFNNDPNVLYAEPNYYRYPYNINISKIVPNDNRFSSQWALNFIEFNQAWALSKKPEANNPILIGVVDSAFDISNPDLKNQVWINSTEILNGIDDDLNGYVDDINGYDFGTYPNGSQASSLNANDAHGTHVAGISIAEQNNDLGIVGIQPYSKFIGCKISDNNNFTDPQGNVIFTDSAIINAFEYLINLKNRGENIVAINASFGGPGYSQSMYDSIIRMRDAGIILCTASGNEGLDVDANSNNYPNNFNVSNIISVAAINQNDSLAGYSNYGINNVDIAAPGSNIISSIPITSSNTPTIEININSLQISDIEILEFCGQTTDAGISGNIIFCGLGYPNEIPSEVNGNIALIQRGDLFFSEKVNNVMQAGAKAAIIFNNTNETSSSRMWTLQNDRSPPWIPCFSISQTDGNNILSNLPKFGIVKYNYQISDNSCYIFDGTSMATPIITGAVAFAALNFPKENIVQRKNRIMQAIDYKNYLANKVGSGGTLNLRKIIDLNNDYIPDWWNDDVDFILPKITSIRNDSTNNLSFDFLAHKSQSFKLEYSYSLEENIWNTISPNIYGEGYNMRAVVDLSLENDSNFKKIYYRLNLAERN